jgi:hypothetical protein
MKGPIIIAGFGRSGTTWLSDILSKALGGLMLFEPFHPLVCADAADVTYSVKPTFSNTIKSHWEQLLSGPCTNRWLIRNHLRSPIDTVPEHYIQDIWNKSPIIGYKTIRTNHLLKPWIRAFPNGAVLYIIRHPLAVLASINNRQRFWEEFGWSWHYQKFLKELREINRPEVKGWLQCEKELQTPNEQILFMWTVSQEIALSQVKSISGSVICYEDLYMSPFEETHKILTLLGHGNRSIHPSYLFEPSLTTHRTFHNSNTGLLAAPDQLPKIFWESSIKQEEEKSLLELIRRLKPKTPEVLRYLKEV